MPWKESQKRSKNSSLTFFVNKIQ